MTRSMFRQNRQSGFTLIELMIAVAIIAVLASIALPLYSGYIQTSREGALTHDINTIRVFEEDYKLRKGTYLGGNYTGGAADASLAPLGWDPQKDDVDFAVVANADVSYQVTATDDTGVSLCLEFPSGNSC